MNDTRKHIAGIAPCGCMKIIMTLKAPAHDKFPAHKATPQEMADFWQSVAKSKVELKV